MTNPVAVQTVFRARDDSQPLNTDSWTFNLNANWTQNTDVVFRIRFQMEETAARNFTFTGALEYNKNSAGWNAVTTTSPVQFTTSVQYAHNDATTKLLTGSTRTFDDGTGVETGSITSQTINNECCENEYALLIDSTQVVDNDSIQIRLSGMTSWTNTPTITVNEPVPASDHRAIYAKGKDTTSDHRPIYVQGSNPSYSASDHRPIFAKGRADTSSNRAIYSKGKADSSSNRPIYTRGSLNSSSNRPIYVKGKDNASDHRALYVKGKADTTSNRAIFTKGQANSASNRAIYAKGIANISDHRPLYGKGMAVASDHRASYVRGIADILDHRALYALGGIEVTDHRSMYVLGQSASTDVSDHRSLFTLGINTLLVPDGDVTTVGLWRTKTGGVSNLYQGIDETFPASDSDAVVNIDPQDGDYYECTLQNPSGTPSGDVVIVWRGFDASGLGDMHPEIQLREGASTVIASRQVTLTTTRQYFYLQLTPAEKASVSDWSDLRLRMYVRIFHQPAYFLATDGDNGGNGSISEPWATFAYAVTQLTPGDTLYIRGGTYNQRLICNYDGGGSVGRYVTFRNYPGETVTIDGNGISIPSEQGLVCANGSSGADYIRFSGLRVIRSEKAGIDAEYTKHVIIDHCYTYDTQYSGISVWGVDSPLIEFNEVEYANRIGAEEAITVSNSPYAIVRYNIVHDGGSQYGWTGGQGINFKDGSEHGRCYGNLVYNLNQYAFGVDAWSAHSYDIMFYNNIAHDCSQGYIVECEHGHDNGGNASDIWFFNNIAYHMKPKDSSQFGEGYGTPPWGEEFKGYVKDIYFINNVAYDCGYGFYGRNDHASSDNIVIRNNIFAQNQSNPQITLQTGTESKYDLDNNLFHGNTNAPLGTNPVTGDPLFLDPTTTRNFHISSGSPAIAAGLATNAPTHDFDGVVRGVAIDIGAYEYVGTVQEGLVFSNSINSGLIGVI